MVTHEIEEVVGTGKLLQRLENNSERDAVEHARGGDELVPHRLLLGLGVKLGLDLSQLSDDNIVVLRHSVETRYGGTGSVDFSVAVVVPRTLREHGHATTENEGEEEGQAESDTPLGSTFKALGSQVNAVSQEDTEGDEKLVGTNHGTTDVLGGALSLVHGHNKRATTDTETSNPTTQDHLNPVAVRSRDLNDQADHEDDTPHGDGPFTTKLISDGSTTEGTDECSDRQKTDDQTRADVAESIRAVTLEFTVALKIVGHFLKTGDLTGIITEQKTTHRHEEAHDSGTQCNPRNMSIDAKLIRLFGADGLLAGILLRLGGRGDTLPMVGRRFRTHGDIRNWLSLWVEKKERDEKEKIMGECGTSGDVQQAFPFYKASRPGKIST